MCQVIPILFLFFFFFNLTELGKLHLSSNPHKVPKGFSSPTAVLGLNVSRAVCTTRGLLWEFYLQECCMSKNCYYSNPHGILIQEMGLLQVSPIQPFFLLQQLYQSTPPSALLRNRTSPLLN